MRMIYTLHQGNLLLVGLSAYTRAPGWSGTTVSIPLEDNAVVTGRGV